MKKKIGWLQGNENWAFRNVCTHLKRALPEFEQMDMEFSDSAPADTYFITSPHMLHGVKQPERAVLHLDSVRALYE